MGEVVLQSKRLVMGAKPDRSFAPSIPRGESGSEHGWWCSPGPAARPDTFLLGHDRSQVPSKWNRKERTSHTQNSVFHVELQSHNKDWRRNNLAFQSMNLSRIKQVGGQREE